MPRKCCVPKCNTNYQTGAPGKVFRFPDKEEEKEKWIRAIPRKRVIFCEEPYCGLWKTLAAGLRHVQTLWERQANWPTIGFSRYSRELFKITDKAQNNSQSSLCEPKHHSWWNWHFHPVWYSNLRQNRRKNKINWWSYRIWRNWQGIDHHPINVDWKWNSSVHPPCEEIP